MGRMLRLVKHEPDLNVHLFKPTQTQTQTQLSTWPINLSWNPTLYRKTQSHIVEFKSNILQIKFQNLQSYSKIRKFPKLVKKMH